MKTPTTCSDHVRRVSAARTRRRFLSQTAAGAVAAAGAWQVLPRKASARVLGANDRLGFAMIGCGGEGNYLLGLVQSLRDAGTAVEIVAVCDIYRPRLTRTASRFGVKAAYSRHQDLLQDPAVDAVGIATPDHIHGGQVIDAVRAGKDVYCEKPVTHWRQIDLTRRMTEEVRKSGRVFQLGTQYMSDPAWHKARELIAEGLIGRVVHVECGFFRVGDWGERGMPIDDPDARPGPDLDWEAFLGDAPPRPFDASRFFRWRMYEDYSGGPVTDLYPHAVTQAVYMAGLGIPELVTATGGKLRYQEREVPDTFHLLADYPGQVTLSMVGTQANDHPGAPARAPSRAPVIRGWDGTITFEGSDIVFTPGPDVKDRPARRIPAGGDFDHAAHMADFLACCRTRKTPSCPIDLTFQVQTALQMAVQAWRAGRAARFDPASGKIVV